MINRFVDRFSLARNRRLVAVGVIISSLVAFVTSAGVVRADQLSPEMERLIEQRVEQGIDDALTGESFDLRVEQAILKFIEKQNRARAQQQQGAAQQAAQNVAKVDASTDFIRGNPDAEFSLIEYSDYECPYCKRFHVTATQFIQNNPEVNWVYRHFPLDFHNPGAQKEAEAAECAGYLGGNDAFWNYSDQIYQRTRSNGKGFPVSNLVPLAAEFGLDRSKFEACLESGQFRDKVLAQLKNGQQSGVSGTPGNFLRHRATGLTIPIQGAQPLENLQRALALLKSQVDA
ncbi:hypothetical protein BGP75_16680 [Motiliproteus sp. MSK22-1]|nr:hypothetical protein BGP75_16680 [Motiliproteus sp. MSK22-1]